MGWIEICGCVPAMPPRKRLVATVSSPSLSTWPAVASGLITITARTAANPAVSSVQRADDRSIETAIDEVICLVWTLCACPGPVPSVNAQERIWATVGP